MTIRSFLSSSANFSIENSKNSHPETIHCDCCDYKLFYFPLRNPWIIHDSNVNLDMDLDHRGRSNDPVLTIKCNGGSDFFGHESMRKDFDRNTEEGWSPTAPSPGLVLFNSEEQSDLIFIVTMDSSNQDRDGLKFPAHSFIIKDSSPIFGEIIQQLNERQNSSDQKPIINIQCRPETLHMLMSYIYKKEVEISCVSSCLALLEVSVKFMLTDLIRICLTFLWNCATEFNVLQVLSSLRQIESTSKTFDHYFLPSQNHPCRYHPSLTENNENLLKEVTLKCYQILDENAEKVLQSEAICGLERDMLTDILGRDSLNLKSELTAFHCIQRWSLYQCQRELREIGHKSKSDLLGEAKFTVRYLTMTVDQFMKGPYSSDILSMDDKTALHQRLLDPEKALPDHLMSAKMDIPRKFLKSMANRKKLWSSHPNGISPTLASYDRKKGSSALKKFLNGLGDVMIFAIRIFD